MSWLTVLKVIPWAQVIEHGPKVVEKAREMLSKQQADAAQPAGNTVGADAAFSGPLDEGRLVAQLEVMQAQVHALQDQLGQWQAHTQAQAQTLSELAEQNWSLLQVVQRLRRGLWALVVGSLLGWVVLFFTMSGVRIW